MSSEPSSGYTAEASALDLGLDVRLREIRTMQDSGALTVREAADLRVGALEVHLDLMRHLRHKYFGTDGE